MKLSSGDHATPLLRCSSLTIEVAGRRLVQALDLQVLPGSMTFVLGCNGAGKTTTLHTLAGIRARSSGEIFIDEHSLETWGRKPLARRLGLLTQNTEDPFPATVLEAVLIGRHPHIGFWQWENDADRAMAVQALEAVGLSGFESRDIATLSGGERRRVALATILTQDPAIALLDEPTNQLDPHHQMDVLRLFRMRADAGSAVVATVHDAGLAARFADQVLLLFGNGEWSCGPTDRVLTASAIGRLYGVPMRELAWQNGRTFVAE